MDTYTVFNHDGSRPTFAVADMYCPRDEIHILSGAMMVPLGLARRMPKPDSVVRLRGAKFKAWSLKGKKR